MNYKVVFKLPQEQNAEGLQESHHFCCEDARTDFIVRAISLCPKLEILALINGKHYESIECIRKTVELAEYKIAEGETHYVESDCYDSEVWEQFDRKLMCYVTRCTPERYLEERLDQEYRDLKAIYEESGFFPGE